MKRIIIYKNKIFKKKTGTLIPINFDKKYPIYPKRIFFIYGKKNKIRGDHAHKKCSQFFYCLSGKILIKIDNLKKKNNFILDYKKNKSLLLPPKHWCSIKFLEKKCLLMVICDRYYEYNDYIHSYKDFRKYLTKR
jgi:dTDP-4-dehydrorhamnose 3,5-epimerase-like enzyme